MRAYTAKGYFKAPQPVAFLKTASPLAPIRDRGDFRKLQVGLTPRP